MTVFISQNTKSRRRTEIAFRRNERQIDLHLTGWCEEWPFLYVQRIICKDSQQERLSDVSVGLEQVTQDLGRQILSMRSFFSQKTGLGLEKKENIFEFEKLSNNSRLQTLTKRTVTSISRQKQYSILLNQYIWSLFFYFTSFHTFFSFS